MRNLLLRLKDDFKFNIIYPKFKGVLYNQAEFFRIFKERVLRIFSY